MTHGGAGARAHSITDLPTLHHDSMHTSVFSVAIALIACAVSASAQAPRVRRPAQDTTRVVFVCEHGSVKSVIAATLFNRLAMERGVAARAVSRGTAPDRQIPQLVRDGLRADGADIGDVRPTGLDASDARRANMFVAFDVGVPSDIAAAVPVRRWDGTPSVMSSYAGGRDAIATRVTELIAELERTKKSDAGPARRRR